MEKRGFFFDLENITIPNVTNFQETLNALLKVPLTIITFDNMPKEKE